MFGPILGAIVSFVLGLFKPKTPDAAIATAKDDGAARQALADTEAADAHVTEAVQAAHAVELHSVAQPDSLRAPDPDSRD
jgi:hypothetical protein